MRRVCARRYRKRRIVHAGVEGRSGGRGGWHVAPRCRDDLLRIESSGGQEATFLEFRRALMSFRMLRGPVGFFRGRAAREAGLPARGERGDEEMRLIFLCAAERRCEPRPKQRVD